VTPLNKHFEFAFVPPIEQIMAEGDAATEIDNWSSTSKVQYALQ